VPEAQKTHSSSYERRDNKKERGEIAGDGSSSACEKIFSSIVIRTAASMAIK